MSPSAISRNPLRKKQPALPCAGCFCRKKDSVIASQDTKQVQHANVDPDDRDKKRECTEPLIVLRKAALHRCADLLIVHEQAGRGGQENADTDNNADQPVIQEGKAHAKKEFQDQPSKIAEEKPYQHDAHCTHEPAVHLDEPPAVHKGRREGNPHGHEDRIKHNARIKRLGHHRNAGKKHAFQNRIERRQGSGPRRLRRNRDAGNQPHDSRHHRRYHGRITEIPGSPQGSRHNDEQKQLLHGDSGIACHLPAMLPRQLIQSAQARIFHPNHLLTIFTDNKTTTFHPQALHSASPEKLLQFLLLGRREQPLSKHRPNGFLHAFRHLTDLLVGTLPNHLCNSGQHADLIDSIHVIELVRIIEHVQPIPGKAIQPGHQVLLNLVQYIRSLAVFLVELDACLLAEILQEKIGTLIPDIDGRRHGFCFHQSRCERCQQCLPPMASQVHDIRQHHAAFRIQGNGKRKRKRKR